MKAPGKTKAALEAVGADPSVDDTEGTRVKTDGSAVGVTAGGTESSNDLAGADFEQTA